jgi:putative SOS response-associated peptidase YedK
MCGRYRLAQQDPTSFAARFGFDERGIDPDTLGRLNISPTDAIAAVTSDGPKTMRWGLVPPWARALRAGPEPINGRSETCASKTPFAQLVARGDRRCLVIADGWYEWMKPEHPKGEKTPFLYRVDGGGPFAFAGVWARARLGGEEVLSAAILTTGANAVCAPVHDRMPCVLADRDAELAWLSGDVDTAAAVELLAPLEEARVQAAPVDRALFKRVDDDALSLF